jgi:hypothetical protein
VAASVINEKSFLTLMTGLNVLKTFFSVTDIGKISGLYYKHMTIVNYTSSIDSKLEALLTDDTRVIIYDRHMFIVQATGYSV